MNFSTLKTTFLLAALTGLLVIIGYGPGGNTGMVIGFLLAGAMNIGSYWVGLRFEILDMDKYRIDRVLVRPCRTNSAPTTVKRRTERKVS